MNIARALLALFALTVSGAAHAQSTLLQAGAPAPGHASMYLNGYSPQPLVQDSGPAAGGGPGIGLSEVGITSRGTGTAPFANSGTGPLAEHFCINDAPTTNATGYHYLCLDPNAQGGALLDYGAAGTAAQLPLKFVINGQSYTFPFTPTGVMYAGNPVGTIAQSGNIALGLVGTTLTIGSPIATGFSFLPTCVSGLVGDLRPVPDSTTQTWGATITGGGSFSVLAYCDGAAWTVAAK